MATLADTRHRGRHSNYRPRHHPATIAAEEKAKADLRAAIADQLGAPRRRRARPAPAMFVPGPPTWDSGTTSASTNYILSYTAIDEWTNTSSTLWYPANNTASNDYYRRAVAMTHTEVNPKDWVLQVRPGTTVTSVQSKWHGWLADGPKTVIGDRRHPGLVHDWKEGDWVSKKVYNRRQAVREAEATRLRDEMQARRLILESARQAADLRATGLLVSLLSPAQLEQWEEQGSIEVTTAKGRIVRLHKGWAGNAVEVCPRTRRNLRRFCIHPAKDLPDADNVAAQLLLLQTDEDLFFATANASAIR